MTRSRVIANVFVKKTSIIHRNIFRFAAQRGDPAELQAAAARHRRLHDLPQFQGHKVGAQPAVATHEPLSDGAGDVERRVEIRGARVSVRLRQQGHLRGPDQVRKVGQESSPWPITAALIGMTYLGRFRPPAPTATI